MNNLVRLAAIITLLWGLLPAGASEIAPGDRKSGYDSMTRENRAMQDDDSANPAMLWVLDGETIWNAKAGIAGQSCADCHKDANASMRGVAARYPAFYEAGKRPVDLEGRINLCRAEKQKAGTLSADSKEMLALTAYIGKQSRGLPVEVTDQRLKPFVESGRVLFNRRQGQINLSCAQCHDDRWGQKLAGSVIPQGHANGYPLYRLEWQTLGSLQRRLRNCLTGMRTELFPADAPEYVDLQLYLKARAQGLKIETPAVRP